MPEIKLVQSNGKALDHAKKITNWSTGAVKCTCTRIAKGEGNRFKRYRVQVRLLMVKMGITFGLVPI